MFFGKKRANDNNREVHFYAVFKGGNTYSLGYFTNYKAAYKRAQTVAKSRGLILISVKEGGAK